MRRVIGVLSMVFVALFVFSACTDTQDQDKSRKDAVKQRETNFDRAEAMWPAPTDLSNFPIRRALVEYTRRQDLVNHPWYIYIMGMDGTPIGYYVGQTYPVSSCNFLSSTERFTDLPDGQWGQVTAPSYDGIFYGGGGASAACQSMFFFDVITNAMHTFVAPMWFASDRPLNIDVPRLGTQGEVPSDESQPLPAPPK
jgi:hypothetical protein